MKNKGFNLIKFLVVIAFIGILISVVLASLSDAGKVTEFNYGDKVRVDDDFYGNVTGEIVDKYNNLGVQYIVKFDDFNTLENYRPSKLELLK